MAAFSFLVAPFISVSESSSVRWPLVRWMGVGARMLDEAMASMFKAAKRGRIRRVLPWARESWEVLFAVPGWRPEMRSRRRL